MRKLTLEEMHQLAKPKGGACLSTEYINSSTKLKWRCSRGHVWKAKPSHVKAGTWCRTCFIEDRRIGLEEMRALAASRGGKCLSSEYVNSMTPLTWECRGGHTWKAAPSAVKYSGTWCPTCGKRPPLSLADAQQLASKLGGECLSTEYVRSLDKLRWRCAKGHEWEATLNSIRNNGTWCSVCAGNAPHTAAAMRKLAEERGGEFLSETYTRALDSHRWKCKNGHVFNISPNKVLNGRWCPRCANLLSERLCREIFESMLEAEFPSRYPDWLLNERGNRMQLDGYCEELALAFEYQGVQHYEQVERFHGSKANLQRRIRDDEWKRLICHERGVTLIEVPYTVAVDKMPAFIKKQCAAAGFQISDDWSVDRLNLKQAYSPGSLEEMRSIAEANGGRCLSNKYVTVRTPMMWECARGHRWKAQPMNIKFGHWCPKCAGNEKLTLEDAKASAALRGGKCLSSEYANYRTPMEWECANGHRWTAPYIGIRNGQWCAECAGNKNLTIEQMRQIAESRGGKCLSQEYQNLKVPLLWECGKGHRWLAPARDVKHSRSWCPICSGKQKKTIKDLQDIATRKGGRCLSTEYENQRTMLLWECDQGHRWKMLYPSILRGSWCPECRKRTRNKKP